MTLAFLERVVKRGLVHADKLLSDQFLKSYESKLNPLFVLLFGPMERQVLVGLLFIYLAHAMYIKNLTYLI